MDIARKLEILADAAKHDVACTSSGVDRTGVKGQLGASSAAGCCHSFTADGRCISLLKVLMTNACIYDCAYCSCRKGNSDVERACFSPRELADLTISFYRRNYVEGLFLSSGVIKSPDDTTLLMIRTLRILRDEYDFRGYIHAKCVPGTSPELVSELGMLADRLSVNMELPTSESLSLLAPDKTRESVLRPMRQISDTLEEQQGSRRLAGKTASTLTSRKAIRKRPRAFGPRYSTNTLGMFAPAGHSTQMIIGATPESDFQILGLTAALYKRYALKRVFFSAYNPINRDPRLPDTDFIPLDREHRLYQADWLLRFYGYDVSEIIDEGNPFLRTDIDPKANWAINNLDEFPIEVNKAPYEMLLRVPGIGVRGARSIMKARRQTTLGEQELKKLGIAYKRARYFITCNGTYMGTGIDFSRDALHAKLASRIDGGNRGRRAGKLVEGQMSLFDSLWGVTAPTPALDIDATQAELVDHTCDSEPMLLRAAS